MDISHLFGSVFLQVFVGGKVEDRQMDEFMLHLFTTVCYDVNFLTS